MKLPTIESQIAELEKMIRINNRDINYHQKRIDVLKKYNADILETIETLNHVRNRAEQEAELHS